MFIIFSLSRPGMCAGALPLHQLLHKLTRSGQHKAVAALRGLSAPLPPDARVRWRIYGTSCTNASGWLCSRSGYNPCTPCEIWKTSMPDTVS